MKINLFRWLLIFLAPIFGRAQDTFTIVAVDPSTGEVGSAGGSCVDLFVYFTHLDNSFIADLVPGVGAIATQANYDSINQNNALARMLAGDTPQQIVSWLRANDVAGNNGSRQYGVAAFVAGEPKAAAHTGSNCFAWKGHRVGPNYSIQGNILLGAQIVDSMEARFLREPGTLADKLMAAMQGANVVGADTRCAPNGTSTLFSYLKVAKPGDSAENPYLKLSLRTRNGDRIEPIDSLQVLYDNWKLVNAPDAPEAAISLRIFPNPTSGEVVLDFPETEVLRSLQIRDAAGRALREIQNPGKNFTLEGLPAGSFWLDFEFEKGRVRRSLVKI